MTVELEQRPPVALIEWGKQAAEQEGCAATSAANLLRSVQSPVETSLERLDGNGWLNDDVVNNYVHLISTSKKCHERKIDYRISLFSEKLLRNGGTVLDTRRSKIKPIFDFDTVIIPFHVGGNHWVSGVIDLAERHIHVYDSLDYNLEPVAKVRAVASRRPLRPCSAALLAWEHSQKPFV